MRYLLLVICCILTFSASAQWYRIDLKLKKNQYRPPFLEQVTDHSVARITVPIISKVKIHKFELDRSDYTIEAVENVIMRTAQHNMRFRIYDDASYNFSELARLYIKQSRFSEAKWYLLQSNSISRVEKDDRHTLLNLIDLAKVKAILGDYMQAQQDLAEAHDIACSKGLKDELPEIEKTMLYVKQIRLSPPKPDLGYAETPQKSNKAE